MKKSILLVTALLSCNTSQAFDDNVHLYSERVRTLMPHFLKIDEKFDPDDGARAKGVFRDLKADITALPGTDPHKVAALGALAIYEANWTANKDFDNECKVNMTDLLIRSYGYASTHKAIMPTLVQQMADSYKLCPAGTTIRLFQVYAIKMKDLLGDVEVLLPSRLRGISLRKGSSS